MTNNSETADREIVITRLIDAPRELVFEALTDPKHLLNWWGPKGFTNTFHEADIRVGGVWRFTMHGPDGTDYPNYKVFKEIVKPERIVSTHGSGPGTDYQFLQTFTLKEQGGKTLLTMQLIFDTAATREMVVNQFNAIEGGNQTLDKLEAYLTKNFTK